MRGSPDAGLRSDRQAQRRPQGRLVAGAARADGIPPSLPARGPAEPAGTGQTEPRPRKTPMHSASPIALSRSPPRPPARTKRPVTLALQGGGALGAFTWGVLDRLL